MKNLIVGTAGHIDHGKTTLIRGLTGRNTDRLKEEQKRGISIDLGFTYFDLPSGQRAGIIDVPGHEKFIKNMLAGLVGIDIVLLVIAADEGIMPQTKEHMQILDLLGFKDGIIVLNKIDMVDEEWIQLIEEDIRGKVQGTFLENSPLVKVSSKTGQGLDELIGLIDQYSLSFQPRDIYDSFRLPIDRSFVVSGFGTIVTGTLIAGRIRIGDEVQVYPGERVSKIRTLQVHDRDAEIAYAGQRVAINLPNIKKEDVFRGQVLAPVNTIKTSEIIDVKLRLLDDIGRNLENNSRIRLYVGSKEVLGRVRLLDRDAVKKKEEAYAQIILEEEVAVKIKDRFIIRNYSPMYTLGGGIILDIASSRKKPGDKELIREFKIKEEGSPLDILEGIIKNNSSYLSLEELVGLTNFGKENIDKYLEELVQRERVMLVNLSRESYVFHRSFIERSGEEIVNYLEDYHKKNPLKIGAPKEEVRSRFLSFKNNKLGDFIVDFLVEKAYIEQDLNSLKVKGFNIILSDDQEKIRDGILKSYRDSNYSPEKKENMLEAVGGNKNDKYSIFNLLVAGGELIKLNEEIYMEKNIYNRALNILVDYLKEKGEIDLGTYRDLLDVNRKISMALLESFDRDKITRRLENKRYLNI